MNTLPPVRRMVVWCGRGRGEPSNPDDAAASGRACATSPSRRELLLRWPSGSEGREHRGASRGRSASCSGGDVHRMGAADPSHSLRGDSGAESREPTGGRPGCRSGRLSGLSQLTWCCLRVRCSKCGRRCGRSVDDVFADRYDLRPLIDVPVRRPRCDRVYAASARGRSRLLAERSEDGPSTPVDA